MPLLVAAACLVAVGCEKEPSPPLLIAPGTELVIALDDPLSSELSRIGEEFDGRLIEPVPIRVSDHETVTIPRGTEVRGRLLEVVPSRAAADRGARMTLVLRALQGEPSHRSWQELRTLPLRLITLGPSERNEVLPTTGGPAQRLTIHDVLSTPTGESLPVPAEGNEVVLRRGQRMRFIVIGEHLLEAAAEPEATVEASVGTEPDAERSSTAAIATETPQAAETTRAEQ
jgi:hypothetical protein